MYKYSTYNHRHLRHRRQGAQPPFFLPLKSWGALAPVPLPMRKHLGTRMLAKPVAKPGQRHWPPNIPNMSKPLVGRIIIVGEMPVCG